MTKREKEIIDILRNEPMISQNDLAKRLGISRSSAAVHITNMMKKGIIAGKGYVIREEAYVAVLGGANIDILGFPEKTFRHSDSNPGFVLQSVGGVGRNIAENLARLGTHVRLLTLVGEDQYGSTILNETKNAGVDTSYIQKVSEYPTGLYLSIQDEKGMMRSAISQMAIFDTMDESYPESVLKIMETASSVIVDTNISERALSYLTHKLTKQKLYLDTVSTSKAKKVKDIIGRFDTVKPNKEEAEMLTGIEITNHESLKANGRWFREQGCSNVIITLGEKGAYALNDEHEGIVSSGTFDIKDSNGAGDAFMAAMVNESLATDDIRKWVESGVSAAIITMVSENTINKDITPEFMEEVKKTYKIKWKNI